MGKGLNIAPHGRASMATPLYIPARRWLFASRSARRWRNESSGSEFLASRGTRQPRHKVCGSWRDVVAMPERKIRDQGKLCGERPRQGVTTGLHDLAGL